MNLHLLGEKINSRPTLFAITSFGVMSVLLIFYVSDWRMKPFAFFLNSSPQLAQVSGTLSIAQ